MENTVDENLQEKLFWRKVRFQVILVSDLALILAVDKNYEEIWNQTAPFHVLLKIQNKQMLK